MTHEEILTTLGHYVDYLIAGSTAEAPLWNIEKVRSGKPNKWNYIDGCMITACLSLYKTTGDEKFLDFSKKFLDYFVKDNGVIETYDPAEYNLDNVNQGKNLFTLYDLTGDQRYRDAIETIRGHIDFIFGGANAVFDTCRLEPWHHISGTCYITAPSTPAGKPGYLFVNCTVQGSCAPGSVYLGRPWRADAACYWLDCALSDEVCADGWDNWRDPENEKTARFGEHGSTGPGSAAKRAFGSVDDDSEANAQREMYARVKAEFGVE